MCLNVKTTRNDAAFTKKVCSKAQILWYWKLEKVQRKISKENKKLSFGGIPCSNYFWKCNDQKSSQVGEGKWVLFRSLETDRTGMSLKCCFTKWHASKNLWKAYKAFFQNSTQFQLHKKKHGKSPTDPFSSTLSTQPKCVLMCVKQRKTRCGKKLLFFLFKNEKKKWLRTV